MEHATRTFTARSHDYSDMLTRADSPVVSKRPRIDSSNTFRSAFAAICQKMDQMDREMQTRHVAITISQDGTILVHGSPSCGHLMTVMSRYAYDMCHTKRIPLLCADTAPPQLEIPNFVRDDFPRPTKHPYREIIRLAICFLLGQDPTQSIKWGHSVPPELSEIWPKEIPFARPKEVKVEKLVWDVLRKAVVDVVHRRHRENVEQYNRMEQQAALSQTESNDTTSDRTAGHHHDSYELHHWYCVPLHPFLAIRGALADGRMFEAGPISSIAVQDGDLVVTIVNAIHVTLIGAPNELRFAYAGFSEQTVKAFISHRIVDNISLYLGPTLKLASASSIGPLYRA